MTTITAARRRLSAAGATLAVIGALLAGGAETTTVASAESSADSSSADAVELRVGPINLTAPSRVAAGRPIRFSGSVAVARRTPRVVVLSERVRGRWHPLARKRTARGGTFVIAVPAGRSARARTFRASAPAVRGLRALASSAVRVNVATKPAPEPEPSLQEADDWSYLFDGGSRWNPCTTIRWAYNPAGERYAALADVTAAFAQIGAASGLTFQYVGATSYRYLGDVTGFPSGTSDIAIGWATEAELGDLSGDVVGVGGGYASAISGHDVRWRINRGYLTLDQGGSVTPPPGFDGPGWGQIMLHEILHSLGLGHAQLSTQLMFPLASARNYRFGAGDLTGMTKVGSAPGCLS